MRRLRPVRVESGHWRRYSKAMFRYDVTTHIIKDDERGLLVTQTAGPGHGVYAGLMSSAHDSWSIRFLVHRTEVESEQGAGQVMLKLRVYPPKGHWNRPEVPADLAREAAVAREIGFYRTQPQCIQTN
jgi:hypothetical protein